MQINIPSRLRDIKTGAWFRFKESETLYRKLTGLGAGTRAVLIQSVPDGIRNADGASEVVEILEPVLYSLNQLRKKQISQLNKLLPL